MDAWIDLARGPLFRLSLAVCVLGLLYHVGVAAYSLRRAWQRAGDRLLPLPAIGRATLDWVAPRRLLKARPLYSIASFAFHVGVIVVPLFLAGHVILWQQDLPLRWPRLPSVLADILTLVALSALSAILLARVLTKESRSLTRPQDAAVLVLLGAVLLAGFLAAHPSIAPFDARALLLVHVLLGDLVLVLTPLTKIVHCILFPVMQLAGEIGWHFPAESGRHVAVALGKEGERI
jgi:nitrate reductase gamma subunit